MRVAGVILLGLALVITGCAVPDLATPRSDAPAVDSLAPAPGCDPARRAVAHRAGVALAPDAAALLPVGCEMKLEGGSWEPNVGVCPATGTVFYYRIAPRGAPDSYALARSTDDGAIWTLHEPSVEGAGARPLSLDPFMYVDPGTCRVFVDDIVTGNCAQLSFSDDEGDTWSHSISGCTEFDHVTLFAGPPVTSPTLGYPNVVYRCAINVVAAAGASFSSTCQRSLDGGLSWTLTGEPAFVADPSREGHGKVPGWCDGGLGHGVVDEKGTIYLPKGFCGQPFLAVSRDEGLSWERVQVSDLGMAFRSDGFYDHDAGVGVDPDGNVYYAWVARDRLPYLSVSRDGGLTWSPPRMVAAPGILEASMLQLAAGGAGKLALQYMGSTNSPREWEEIDCKQDLIPCLRGGFDVTQGEIYPDEVTWNGYLAITLDALSEDPLFFTASVNDPEDPLARGDCGPYQCAGVGDFLDMRIGPDGTPWAAFVREGQKAQAVVGRLFGGPSLLDAAASG